jgi:putative transposase
MHLSDIGQIMGETQGWLSEQYPYVTLDEYVLMPNHLHGIIALHEQGRGGSRTAPTEIGKLLWQRNYSEHIIYNSKELEQIPHNIANNPLRWELDYENPMRRSEYDV